MYSQSKKSSLVQTDAKTGILLCLFFEDHLLFSRSDLLEYSGLHLE